MSAELVIKNKALEQQMALLLMANAELKKENMKLHSELGILKRFEGNLIDFINRKGEDL